MPQEGKVSVLVLSPEELAKGGERAVIREQIGPSGSAIQWFPKPRIPMAYRCEITNDTNAALLNVAITLQITFAKTEDHEQVVGQWYLPLVRLDPGPNNKFILFFRNVTSQLAFIVISDSGTAYKLGEETTKRPIRIAKPVDFLDQIIGVPPFVPHAVPPKGKQNDISTPQ